MIKFHRLKVAEVRRETPDSISVRFEVPPELREEYLYSQGQHLTLCRAFDGVEERRSYSICSGVQERELRVAIKRIDGGLFSNWANDHLKAGDELEVMPPVGNFYPHLPPGRNRHYVAFAAGSGITPIMSMIRTNLAEEPDCRFTLVYGNRDSRHVIFLEELADLKNRYMARFNLIHVFSREPQEVELFNGRIDAAKVNALLDSVLPPECIDQVFLCGPQPMIETVRETLASRGVPRDHIHFELFTSPYAGVLGGAAKPKRELKPEDAAHLSEVTIILDGKRTTFSLSRGAEPVLDAALRLRRDMPYACKGGVCATCKARLLEGKVEMDVNYGLEESEVEAGFVLTCQCHPITDRVVLDYDQR
ncbi:MAG TPA: 1,2-phenylacetyl-CoA epoxidase subunit PaaE [Candidatus Competibacteraceae bacterium]|nr:1,2-phenylacetyl-CoA epoxidase subunit PaaE [Candidatus Competibacteraceae bacterium]